MTEDKDKNNQKPQQPIIQNDKPLRKREGYTQDSTDKRPGGGDQTRDKKKD